MPNKSVRGLLEEITVCIDYTTDKKPCRRCQIKIDQALQAIRQIVDGCVPEKKQIIDIKKKMCFNSDYPTPCYYDEPSKRGDTCLMQDKGIPKENCPEYKNMCVEYETFEEHNSAIDTMNSNLDKLFGEGK